MGVGLALPMMTKLLLGFTRGGKKVFKYKARVISQKGDSLLTVFTEIFLNYLYDKTKYFLYHTALNFANTNLASRLNFNNQQ